MSLSASQITVSNNSKRQIWKQFTTATQAVVSAGGLFLITQRYKFESNSQLFEPPLRVSYNCF